MPDNDINKRILQNRARRRGKTSQQKSGKKRPNKQLKPQKILSLMEVEEIHRVLKQNKTYLRKEQIQKLYKEDPLTFDLDQRVTTSPKDLGYTGEVNKKVLSEKMYQATTPADHPSRFINGQYYHPNAQVVDAVERRSSLMGRLSTGNLYGASHMRPNYLRAKIGGVAGAAIGLTGNFFDGENDTLLGGLGDSVKTAGLGIIGAYAGNALFGNTQAGRMFKQSILDDVSSKALYKPFTTKMVQYVDRNHSDDVAMNTKNKITIGEISKNNIKNHVKPLSETEVTKKLQKGKKFLHNLPGLSIAAVGVVGLTSLLDIGMNMEDNTSKERMLAEQEKNFIRQQNLERRAMKSMGYGNIDMGQIAIDMFNERIGHNKMGNAKFE